MKPPNYSPTGNAPRQKPTLRVQVFTPELLVIFKEWYSQLPFMDKVIIKSLIAGDNYATIAKRFEMGRTTMWKHVARLKGEFREIIF